MVILAGMLAYLGALGRHLGPRLLQLALQEASRWSLEGGLFGVFWELTAGITGDPPQNSKNDPEMGRKWLKSDPQMLES